MPSLKLCFAELHYDPAHRDPHAYLDLVPIHRELPREMARLGHRVEMVHLFPTAAEFEEDGVRYRFIPPARAARALFGTAGRLLGRDPILYVPATRAIAEIRRSRPDLIHFHGTSLHWNLLLLFAALGAGTPPVVLHYHGGFPAVNPLARMVQRLTFRRSARQLFTTREHARPFVEARVLGGYDTVVELMETSSAFRPQPRAEARQKTGMEGDPVFLWAGRLHPIKDPLTALRGFERILEAWPDARLYLHYLTDELLPEIRSYAAARPALDRALHFRGRAPFLQMEAICSSADFLLQASLREFSGCAVLEAMACGAIPVVTNIPSFRSMTADGRHGVLFPPGDWEALAMGTLALSRADLAARSAEVRAHFQRELSFPAMARRLEKIYRWLTVCNRGPDPYTELTDH
jgi:glycosyltransferase involved in cell wall biosynthesis